MAYSPAQLRQTVHKYVRLLKKEIPIDRVILFGSYAWGHPKPYSDIDLAVFSPKFLARDEIKNMQYLFKRACEIDTAIEPHPFHTKDLNRPDERTLLYQIIKRGKKVSLRD